MENETERRQPRIVRIIRERPRVAAAIILLAIVLVCLLMILPHVPVTSLTASGIVEATEVTVASKVLARVTGVYAEEGDGIKAGQLLVRLQDTDFAAQVRQAKSALAAAQARLLEALNGPRPEQIDQGRAAVSQAQAAVAGARKQLAIAEQNYADTRQLEAALESTQTQYTTSAAAYQRASEALEVVKQGARAEQIQAARAAVEQAQAVSDQADSDLARAQKLYQKGAIAASQLDAAKTASESAQAQVKQAKARLADLKAGATPAEIREAEAAAAQAKAQMNGTAKSLRIAREAYYERLTEKSQLTTAHTQYETTQSQLQGAQAALRELLAGTRVEQIQAARAQANQANAAVAQAQTFLDSTTVASPVDGAVITRAVEPGDLATIGSTLMVLADLTRVKLKVYVEEPVYGRIKLGQDADVSVDSYPNRVFKGRVTEIAQEAEFTPKEIQTPEQRAKLVFAVKIMIPNPDGKLKPGMPADAVVNLQPVAE